MAKGRLDLVCKTCKQTFRYDSPKLANATARANWEEYNEGRADLDCKECWSKEQQAKKKEQALQERKELKEFTTDYTLPKLEGTERQISWAEVLRMKFLKKIRKDLPAEQRELVQDFLNNVVSSKYWIETREFKNTIRKDIVERNYNRKH